MTVCAAIHLLHVAIRWETERTTERNGEKMKNRWRALLLTLAFVFVAAGVLGSNTADAKGKKSGIVSVKVLNSKVVRVKLAKAG